MLNKRALRKFADSNPAPSIPPGHGLLHTPQVEHIVRTTVRIIDHRRTLVLYVYDRQQIATGSASPSWTMFQEGDDYITLTRREDGTIHWRTSAFRNLGGYRFTDKCAFYSARDEQRVCSFLRDHDHGGMEALVRAQQAILDDRARERRLMREKNTVQRMRPLHALLRGLPGWIRREVMPAYFRCEHTSARKPVTGICTSCGKGSTLPRAAHNDKIACPRCKRELTVKSVWKDGKRCDQDTVQVVEKTGGDGIVARIVKVYYNYSRDSPMPEPYVHENARIFMRRGPDGKISAAPYYFSYSKGTLTHWLPGERPVYFPYNGNFEADVCGHVYPGNLPEALAGTPWEYCPLAAFYGHFREPMEMLPFLRAYLDHPRLEHLVKTGFFSLASDLAYRGDYGHVLDESRGRTHRILRIQAEDVPFLRELDVNMKALKIFQGCANLKGRRELLRWQLGKRVDRDVAEILAHVTPHKLMKYMDTQYAVLGTDGGRRYSNMQHAVSEYRDYLGMCAQLCRDLSDGSVLYPRDLRTAHDNAQGCIKAQSNTQLRQAFMAAMEVAAGRLEFQDGGMAVVLPASPDDVVAEGRALHHCVGSYIDRVARRECVILFVRRREAPDEPFYTVEIRGREVVQVRGRRNGDPTPEVWKFMERWERQVLRAA